MTDRAGELAGYIQSSALSAAGFASELRGRATRYDIGTSCGPYYVDISSVTLPPMSL